MSYEDKLRSSIDEAERVIAAGPYAASWESILARYRAPRWYEDAKFGIFIHWGVYCVPAFGNEWYPRNMYQQGTREFEHHLKNWGPHDRFGYKDFIPLFTASQFDPREWAALFRRSGAKFVIPVAEHHDGFAMYDTAFSEWNAAKMGPRRDVVGELASTVRGEGLVFGLSTHRAENCWFFDGGRSLASDVTDDRFRGLYNVAQPHPDDHADKLSQPAPPRQHLDEWFARTCELVDKYEPQIVWFDWWIQHYAFSHYLPRFAAYYYNRAAKWDRGVAVNYKHDAFPTGAGVFDIERGQAGDIRPDFWQTDTSVSRTSWGYVEGHDYKPASELIHDLIDIVSKNGALLLNIGPKADGTIPESEQRVLLEIGTWLETNGEAIYGTRPWKVYGEGPTILAGGSFTDKHRQSFTAEDVRFTTRPGVLYAMLLGWPQNCCATIRSLGTDMRLLGVHVRRITMLGLPEERPWSQDRAGLCVQLPASPPCGHAVALKIELRAG